MPIVTTRRHRQVLTVVRDNHFFGGKSRFFDTSYIAANSYSEKYLYPGMVLALDSDTEKYVPYNESASYGTGSDTAVGVLSKVFDVTYDAYMVQPVVHGALIEDRCFVYGGDIGTVPSAVKTALKMIEWV